MTTGLEVFEVSKRFGSAQILRGVSLESPPGRITALIGQNGAGKSTLFKIVMGLIKPDSGRVTLDGRDVLSLPLHKKARAGLGYLSQECGSFGELSVKDNLLAILEILPIDKRERMDRLDELLSLTGIGEIGDRQFNKLSRGEQRRLEIAKALATRPRILLLDEPFSGLDPRIIEELEQILLKLAADKIGILLTDHNAHMTLSFVEHVYLLAGGKIVCDSPPGDIVSNKDARRLYLGQKFSL